MRRLVVALVWLAALASVVLAVGMRVRAKRLADPAQTVAAYLRDVPSGFAEIATVISRDASSIQIEIRADQAWVRSFAQRNGFTAIDTSLDGLAADRWTLTDTKRKGAVAHLLLPLDGQPTLLTVLFASRGAQPP